MNISEQTKEIYKSSSVTKHLVVQFPELGVTVSGSNIYADSMKLSESLSNSDSIEFVGCIASKFEVQIRDFGVDIKGKKIYAYIYTDGTELEPIPLFHGIVDEAKLQSNHKIKDIVAYDYLYTKGNIEVANWYNGIQFPKTLGEIRRSLFSYIGLTYIDRTLPNDSVVISKQFNPKTLQSISVIKSICQINGAFGIINRDGYFEFRILPEIQMKGASIPSLTLYPSFYPGQTSGSDSEPEQIARYRSLSYQEFSVKPVDKIQIRQSEDDEGVTYGSGTNKYIIQANMFTYGLKGNALLQIAKNMYPNIISVSYIPYSVNNDGFPWIECGTSIVDYYVYDFDNSTESEDVYKEMQFYALNRTLTGIQNLQDTYNAEGDEYQKEFITDIHVRLDSLKQNIKDEIEETIDEDPEIFNPILEDYTYTKEELDPIFTDFDDRLTALEEGGTGEVRVISTNSIPANVLAGVVYLLQGEIVTIY